MLPDDLVDAHVHPEGLSNADLDTLARFGVRRVLACAHDGAPDRRGVYSTAPGWLRHWERLLGPEAARMRRHGLRPMFALGVAPGHAPWHGLEELLHKLPDFLSNPAAVAIGTLALSGAGERERTVLRRQLDLAADLRRPVIVAAPPLRPAGGSRALAAMLRSGDLPPERILVEHATASTLRVLLACGFAVALEPSPGRLTAEAAVEFVRRHGPERLVVTSHAGDAGADLLAVPGFVARLRDAGLSRAVTRRVARDNALRFLGREESARRAGDG